ncbi:MAG: SRPBCC family protein [Polyangiaceae bacterium]|nr:SRPBCC family protein [Polyangiaceae bacterium]
MPRLVLEQALPAPAAAVWPLLVVPDEMSAWSKARVTGVARGDGGGFDGVGATRKITVHTAAGRRSFDEVVVESEPPRRLVYRVFRGLPTRDHEGTISLRDTERGSRLRWDVDFSFWLPGGASAARLIEAQLRESLATLSDVARAARPAPFDARVFAPDDLAPLRAAAEATLADQRALVEELAGDRKRWFAQVYEYVTEGLLALVDAGGARHPGWVLRLIPVFHRYYVDNLRAWRDGGEVEEPWARALRVMDSGDDFTAVVGGLMRGVRAHIEEDLPRALASVWFVNYRERCDYARFRGDYLGLAPVFRRAADRMLDALPRDMVPRSVRLVRRAAPPEVPDALLNRRVYDVPTRRLRAFERGGRVARLLVEHAR